MRIQGVWRRRRGNLSIWMIKGEKLYREGFSVTRAWARWR